MDKKPKASPASKRSTCTDKRILFAILAIAVFVAIFVSLALVGQTAPSKLRVITEDYTPYNYAAPDGQAAGPSTDIVREIMGRTNMDTPIELLPWGQGYQIALSTPNVALYSTSRTQLRENLFKWVGPIATAKNVFFLPAVSSFMVASLDDARQLSSICVIEDDVNHQTLKSNGFTNIVTAKNEVECLQKVSRGEAAAWVGLEDGLDMVAEKAGADPAMFLPEYVLSTEPMYIAFSKGTPDETVGKWRDALDAMGAGGTFVAPK